MIDCACCGAPATPLRYFTMRGVDYDGLTKTFYYVRLICAAGHQYDREEH